MVLHTLAIAPHETGKGLGRAFVRFYAQYALKRNCEFLRLDTNAINRQARKFYAKIGFTEAGIVDTDFNGIDKIHLVLLEAKAAQILAN